MLVTRQYDSENSHWPFSKYDPTSRKSTSSRMSSHYDTAVSTPSDWRGQFPYLEQGETSIFSQPFGQNGNDSKSPTSNSAENETNALNIQLKEEPASPRSQVFRSSPLSKPTGLIQDDAEIGRSIGSTRAESPIRSGTYRLSLSLDSAPSTCHGSEASSSLTGPREKSTSPKDDDEIVFEDEEAMDVDGDQPGQTAAERTAARRKMKRFRLTHQQTRFLMSEFAKQPHPDAAHRERLSREIPGLSPRQVQVWFQNRRAKIKRLNADDRDRMIKMRAVPDDFDNVQALHSPYGAVHGLGAHIASPLEFGSQSYAEHMIRPMMIDVRRSDRPAHLPPTGLTPGFSNLGFNSNMMSPLSSAPHDRYSYTSPLSTPPLTGGLPTSNPFERQNGMDSLHSLHLRDPLTRSRPETVLSPLRTGVSWKSDSMDYSYQGTNTSPNLGHRQQPSYPTAFDSSKFSGNAGQSPTSPIQSPEHRSCFRPASSTVTVNYEFRNSFRSLSPSGAPRLTLQTTQSSSAPVYSTSYPTAPLTAPVDFSPQKNSDSRLNMQEWPASQMSAPIAPASEFPQAFQASQASRTPVSASFGSGFGTGQQPNDNRMSGIESHQRKRSLTLPTNMSRSFFNP